MWEWMLDIKVVCSNIRVVWGLSKLWKKIKPPNLSNGSFRKSDENGYFSLRGFTVPIKKPNKSPRTLVKNAWLKEEWQTILQNDLTQRGR